MSALPKAVQKQVEEANRLAEQLNQERQRPASPPPEAPAPDSGTPPAAAAPPAAPSANGAAPPAPAEGWEQKYRVLQGKYNAEVPRLQRTVNEQSTAISQLQQQLTATQTMLASFGQSRGAAPEGQGSPPAAPAKLVKDEEVREYGPDLTDYIARVAQDALRGVLEQKIQPLQQQMEQVRGVATQAAQRTVKTEQEKVFDVLDKDVPGWREQNVEQGFLDWLQQPDPYSGARRGDLLTQAFGQHDAPRVVLFFKGYRNENAVVTPPAAPAAPAPGAPQKTLDEFVAPGTANAGATGAQDGAGKRTWTQLEIKQFYDQCAAGKYRTNPTRRAEIERDIFAAQREGRIR